LFTTLPNLYKINQNFKIMISYTSVEAASARLISIQYGILYINYLCIYILSFIQTCEID